MTWMLTANGAQIDLRHIEPDSISILDIAHHLAKKDRYAGACSRLYGVAEHSLLTLELLEHEFPLVPPAVKLAALLHDAHEAITGDITTPMKQLLGDVWTIEEHRIQRVVLRRFKVLTAFTAAHDAIDWADKTALVTERAALLPRVGPTWAAERTHQPATWVDFEARSRFTWQDWRQAFLERFAELQYERVQQQTEQAEDPAINNP